MPAQAHSSISGVSSAASRSGASKSRSSPTRPATSGLAATASPITTNARILGVDAALGKSGLAVLDFPLHPALDPRPVQDVVAAARDSGQPLLAAQGAFKTPDKPRRFQLLYIQQQIRAFCLAHGPFSLALVERPGNWIRGNARTNIATIEALAQARGAILAMLAQYAVEEVYELPTNMAKETLVSRVLDSGKLRGTAAKDETSAALRHLGLYSGTDPDIADAVMLAYAGAKFLHARAFAPEDPFIEKVKGTYGSKRKQRTKK